MSIDVRPCQFKMMRYSALGESGGSGMSDEDDSESGDSPTDDMIFESEGSW